MSQLPPPPPTAFPPHPDPSSLQPRPAIPEWRTAKVGWVILNIVIGLGIGFGAFIIAAILLNSGHFDIDSASRTIRASQNASDLTPETQRLVAGMFGAFMIAIVSGVIGWLLFAYLRVRAGVRIALLIGLPVVAIPISYTMMAAVLPRFPGY